MEYHSSVKGANIRAGIVGRACRPCGIQTNTWGRPVARADTHRRSRKVLHPFGSILQNSNSPQQKHRRCRTTGQCRNRLVGRSFSENVSLGIDMLFVAEESTLHPGGVICYVTCGDLNPTPPLRQVRHLADAWPDRAPPAGVRGCPEGGVFSDTHEGRAPARSRRLPGQ